MILKSRQMGMTTQEVIKQLDATMFTKNFTACILAHEDDGIAKIFNTPRVAYDRIPDNLKPEIARGGGSKYEMFFPKMNSRIYCDLESRGDTIQWLHVSEAAFMDKERLDATLQAVPLNGIVTIETTPNGLDNHFYESWEDESSPYEKFFLPWYLHDEYQKPVKKGLYKLTDEEKAFKKKVKGLYKLELSNEQIAYRRFKQAELKLRFIQEYPEDDITCFIHSGRNVVDQALFTSLIEKTKPVLRTDKDIDIFCEKDPKKSYVIGADVAEGKGADYSTAHVICLQDHEEVAFFRGHLSPFLFAKKLNYLASIFSTGARVPLLAPELNNHGHAVLLELRENIKYRNLYCDEGNEDRPGWLTTSLTRALMIDQLIETVSSGWLKLNSKETLKEMRMLIEDKGKIQAPSGKHDDCVIGAAIANQLLLKNYSSIDLYTDIDKKIRV